MEERIKAMLENHYQEISERLEGIEEKLAILKQRRDQDAVLMDLFRNRIISLEASLDEKLGLWKSDLTLSDEPFDDRRL